MEKKFLRSLGPLLGLSLFTVALWVVHHELEEYHYHDIVNQLRSLASGQVLTASSLTVLNYFIMTGYDLLALRYINYHLAFRRIAAASFIGYAFSNSIGLSMLAGGSVRYRLYSAWGLSAEDITKVVAFCTMTLWMGLLAIGGIVFTLEPVAVPGPLHLPFTSARPVGLFFIIIMALFLVWSYFRKDPLKIAGWEFPVPTIKILLLQIAVASLDWAIAGSVLYSLLPSAADISFMWFIGIYLLAQTAGLVSQVPGGLGVFETVVIVLLSKDIPAAAILGALLAYRAIYYLIPLSVAAVMLGAREALERKEGIQRAAALFGQWISGFAPHVLSLTTFLSGIILLFSGATPVLQHRLMWMKDFLPLPVMEMSHFLGSIAGMALLLLARGIQQRLDAAYVLTIVSLAAGTVFSLLKGIDYEEAVALSVMLAALLPCRKYFYRKTSVMSQRFTPAWISAIAIILMSSVWLGIFSYKHVEYSGELWWQFAFSGDASRFLRATTGTLALTLFFALGRLLRPASADPSLPGVAGLKDMRIVIDETGKTYANLALLGDKEILFSMSRRSFIMYGIEGRSWVALGDPVGPQEEMSDLVWQFHEMSDRHGGWTVFYEVGRENLYLYLELGLTVIKTGEEGYVHLEAFSLEGGSHKGFRHTVRQLEKEGYGFSIISEENIPSVIPEFRRISDAWLARKNTREKRFSLGYFNENYLRNFPAAVVRKDGKMIAFANIWAGKNKEELSIDLMRYLPEAPRGIMDYLFVSLMLQGKQQGYRFFNLGMAPFSGLQDSSLAPLWNRLGAFVYRHGEHFYNFQGLRNYKDKFDPEWRSKYIAVPGGLKLPRILTNIASLISGGWKGVVTK
jgi:phosphatidylglycerol lysyltransferase